MLLSAVIFALDVKFLVRIFFFPANALIMNDDCQSPLDVARAKGYSNVVRAIEVYSEFSV